MPRLHQLWVFLCPIVGAAGAAACESASCSVLDAPPQANVQLQVRRENVKRLTSVRRLTSKEPNLTSQAQTGKGTNLVAIEVKNRVQHLRLRVAAERISKANKLMQERWDASSKELDGILGGLKNEISSSEDSCATQLVEYKKQLKQVHSSVTEISTKVKSSEAGGYTSGKSCYEKKQEVRVIEKEYKKTEKKCTMQKIVQKKTLVTLRKEMKVLKKVVKKKVRRKTYRQSRKGRGRSYGSYRQAQVRLLEANASLKEALMGSSNPDHRVAGVRSLVQHTQEVAGKVDACIAKSALAQKKEEHDSGYSEDGDVVFLQEEDDTNKTSGEPPMIQPGCYGKRAGDRCILKAYGGKQRQGVCMKKRYAALKCVAPSIPDACKEVVIELEKTFTQTFTSLTRLVEEYETVTHSKVCEETASQEYQRESTAVQTEANSVCKQEESYMLELTKYQAEYKRTVVTEKKLLKSYKVAKKQCGGLVKTERYMSSVKKTIKALGNCPGLGDVAFAVPKWAGSWIKYTQEHSKTDKAIDKSMRKACRNHFGKGARPAEVSEIDGRSIKGMPRKNTAQMPVLGACPMCEGSDNDGASKTGHGRICWDPGAKFSRKMRRKDCNRGDRVIACVVDGKYNGGGGGGGGGGGRRRKKNPGTTAEPGKAKVTPQSLMKCKGTPVMKTACMSSEDYQHIFHRIEEIMGVLGDKCNHNQCPQADWAGCVLRMAGHDFMDFDAEQGTGGADACTNMDDPDNAGLAECLAHGEFGVSLNDIYFEICEAISLADFLVVAAEGVMSSQRDRVKVKDASAADLDFISRFKFGRQTLDEGCNFQVGRLPNPEGGCPEVDRVFGKELGLNMEGTVALMGVHTLGRAKVENSGYDGFWSDPENSRLFNNNYYVSLLAKGWIPEQLREDKNQWTRADVGRSDSVKEMMLNTDICLAYKHGSPAKPISATETETCCAWLDSFVIGGEASGDHLGVIKNNNGMFCGVDCSKMGSKCGGGLEERETCCSAGGGRGATDCGNPQRPDMDPTAGDGFEQVKLFAAHDDIFIDEFKKAWKHVTEIGHKDLHPLGHCHS